MHDYYRAPTLLLLGLLVAVFATRYAHSRTQRHLLWLLGWITMAIRMAFLVFGYGEQGFGKGIAESAVMIAAVMFLGALSPAYWTLHAFRRALRVSYSVAFAVPVICFAFSTSLFPTPLPLLRALDLFALLASIAIALLWSAKSTLLPRWFNVAWSIGFGVTGAYLAWLGQYTMVLWAAQSGIEVLTAMLVISAYRRLTPGVVFTATGFFAWSILIFIQFLMPLNDPRWPIAIEAINLVRVITAVGMIVLVLEDEALQNKAAQRRDRRARKEMEEYAKLDLSVDPHHDFGVQYGAVCTAVMEASRFRQVAVFLLDIERHLGLAAGCGWTPEVHSALYEFGSRLTRDDLQLCQASLNPEDRRHGNAYPVNLQRCLSPADAEALRSLTDVYAVPITARSGNLQGILLLASLKDEKEPLLPEDLLPMELLVARVAAARENLILSRSIARSEKLAGIGRLAGGVAHELNNPLTVVMGYAELIHESAVEEKVRRNAGVIHSESQRMKQIIDSLARFWKPSPSPVLPIQLSELLTGVQLMRNSEFERQRIRFEVMIPPDLPRILANEEQMRQVLLQILDSSAEAANDARGHQDKRVRVEARRSPSHVQIVVSHSGPGFPDPDKVFDPFFTIKPPGEGPALALSLCYSIVREQGGDLSAQNLQPYGAAVVVELPTETANENSQVSAQQIPA
jgi:signal transduction histidine kinase